MPDDPLLRAKNIARSRAAARWGEHIEGIIGNRLRGMGLACVQRIEVGWKPTRRGGRIIGGRPLAAVMGDFTAIVPGSGRYVMVEVKLRRGRNLSHSDLAPHQHAALGAVCGAGGVALLAWACDEGIALMRWEQAAPCLHPGESMRWDIAAALNLSRIT